MGRYFKRYRGKLVLWMLADLFMALCLVFWSFFVKHMADTVYAADGLTGIQSIVNSGRHFFAGVYADGIWRQLFPRPFFASRKWSFRKGFDEQNFTL